jgi:hypothetical protein
MVDENTTLAELNALCCARGVYSVRLTFGALDVDVMFTSPRGMCERGRGATIAEALEALLARSRFDAPNHPCEQDLHATIDNGTVMGLRDDDNGNNGAGFPCDPLHPTKPRASRRVGAREARTPCAYAPYARIAR